MVSSKAASEDLNMKVISKFDHGCLHCAISKTLHVFKEKKSPQVNKTQPVFFFKMFKMRFSTF